MTTMPLTTLHLCGLLLVCGVIPSLVNGDIINKINGSCFEVEQITYIYDLPCTSCHINMFTDCPDGAMKMSSMNGVSGCTYEQSLGPGPNVTKNGCHHICSEIFNVTSCCQGYWGPHCDECPGGGDNPCNGHGNCLPGENGAGQCTCEALWTGYSCESCVNSTLLYPNCTDVKSPAVCNATCPNNSKCAEVAGEMVCMCEWPYVDHSNDEGQIHCKVVDLCTIPPLCHTNASCNQSINVDQKTCLCDPGYHGDGFVCDPDDPCQINNGGCDNVTTNCVRLSPGKSECQCKDGYFEYVPGHGCSLRDVCKADTCHPRATCTTNKPNTPSCTCLEGYTGDGHNCMGNILKTLKDLNQFDPDYKGQLNLMITAMEKFFLKVLTDSSPITVLVPINKAFTTIGAVDFGQWLSEEMKVKSLLRNHILIGDHEINGNLSGKSVYTLDGLPISFNPGLNASMFVAISDNWKKILKRGIIASNGIIHLTKNLLEIPDRELGNPQMTADKYIASVDVYSLLNQFIEMCNTTVKPLLQQPGVTVFAPPNEAWDKLHWDSTQYLLKPENRDKVEVILKNHIFKEEYEVADFFNTRMLTSAAGYTVFAQINNNRFTFNGVTNITKADIVVENGLLMRTDAVMVPDGISTLPNFCNLVTFDIVQGPCGDCRAEPRCLSPDVPTNVTISCEYYARNGVSGNYEKLAGCSPMCKRSFDVPRCCKGFYGLDCLPCPGGYKHPCQDKGKCDMLTGQCTCQQNFTGYDCSECEDGNSFGQACSQKCTCVKGSCNNGLYGNGKCRTCDNWMTIGENCDKQIYLCKDRKRKGKPKFNCHIHAVCVTIAKHRKKCVCKVGYTGDGEASCTELDPCLRPDRGGCDIQATCERTGPGTNNCTCNNGWSGDGTYCFPASTCNDHANCHQNATCIETFPGSHICRCHDGYHGDGKHFCLLDDMCAVHNGGCHKKAICTKTRPGKVNCTCMVDKGYSGNGYTCIGDLITTIMDNKDLLLMANIISGMGQSYKELLLDRNYTVFAPNDHAFMHFVMAHHLNNTIHQFMTKEVLLSVMNYHMFLNGISLDRLLVLSQFDKMETMADGYYLQLKRLGNNSVMIYPMAHGAAATVIQSDILTTNGYLNIIDKVLLPFVPMSSDDYPDLETFFKLHPKYSIFGDWLKKKNLTYSLENDYQEYTLFVPTNAAMKHLQRSVTREYLLYHVLTIKEMMASASSKTLITALGTRHQLDIKAYNMFNVTVNGIRIVDQDMMTYGGLVNGIDGLLHPVLHRCRETTHQTKYGSCGKCASSWPCIKYYQPYLPNNGSRQPCKYVMKGQVSDFEQNVFKEVNIEMEGCQGLCVKSKTKDGCCAGYYGQTCAECPGGPETPCNGYGQCRDGMDGSGTCDCVHGWTGYSCDTCIEDWTGDNCDVDMKSCSYQNGGCDTDAVCTMVRDHRISCTCLIGFTGDGYNCTGPCDLQNGGCHYRALCTFKAPTGVQCRCKSPFVGNGKTTCNADVMSTLLTLNGTESFIKSTRQLADSDLMANLKNSAYSRKFTLFAPVDEGLPYPIPRREQFQQQIVLGNVILRNDNFQRFNVTNIAGERLVVTFNTNTSMFYVNSSYVVKGNIQCTNGIIHLMSSPFTSVSVETRAPSKSGLGTGLTVGISVAVAILLGSLVGGVVWWLRKSRSNYWQVLNDWRSKQAAHRQSTCSENTLHVVDDDKDEVTPNDTNFDNPLYLAQNLE